MRKKMKRIIVSVLCMFIVVTFMPLSIASAYTKQSSDRGGRYVTNMEFRGHFNCGDNDNAMYLINNSNTGSKIADAAKVNCEVSEFNIASGNNYNKLSAKTVLAKHKKTYVYITRTGIRYHRIKHCRGLSRAKRIYKVSLSTAKAYGLTKCKICW